MTTGAGGPPVVCLSFKSFERNTLQGFCDLRLRGSGMTIWGCTVHKRGDREWIGLPAKPLLDQDRTLLLDEEGKIKYLACVTFEDRDVGERFSIAACKAVAVFREKENGTRVGEPADGELTF